jgi:hypothetical protein
VYRCTPEELDDQDWDRAMTDLELHLAEMKVVAAKYKGLL